MCGMETSGSPSIDRLPRSTGARRSGFDPGSCRGWTPWKSETLAMELEPVGRNKGLSPSHLSGVVVGGGGLYGRRPFVSVAQSVSALPSHGRGHWFESSRKHEVV